ncbi:MAG TPA: imidazolonepropionase [Polyangiaceae bacterium]|nr:imidazolonepropionase [Polyangiaceae bacterium]
MAGLMIINAAEAVTLGGFSAEPARGPRQSELGIIRDAAVFVRDGKIAAVGASDRLRQEYRAEIDTLLDAEGGVVLPGFVDPHTHLVFAGDRADEWERRMQGAEYLDILRSGGGILSTVKKTRAACEDALHTSARRWANAAITCGTTTLEIKSGYCLDRDGEIKLLNVAQRLRDSLPIEIVSTFLGAHVVPPEFKNDRPGYLDLVLKTAATIRERSLAEFFDVFCEQEAFTLEETEMLCRKAQDLGYRIKLHAEQFSDSGATRLGVRLGALSVDHLEQISDDSIAALKSAEHPPLAVLLPAVAFHLALTTHAPGRQLVDAGIPVALATDMNPGSSFTPSMPMAIAIACRTQGLTVAEALVAATINAAHALDRQDSVGSLEPGKRADIIVCDIPDYRHLAYGFGHNPVRAVIANGQIVRNQGRVDPTASPH